MGVAANYLTVNQKPDHRLGGVACFGPKPRHLQLYISYNSYLTRLFPCQIQIFFCIGPIPHKKRCPARLSQTLIYSSYMAKRREKSVLLAAQNFGNLFASESASAADAHIRAVNERVPSRH